MAFKLGSFIKVNEFLSANEYVQSPNLLFFAIMQGDGNFCVYRGTGPGEVHACLWATNSMAPGGRFFAIMQGDGNFCVYKGTGPSDSHGCVWGAQSLAPGGQFFANMQDDGNFCVYKGTGPGDSRGCVWATTKTMYMDANTKAQVDIVTTKTKELFTSEFGIGLPDGADYLRLADYQPVVFGIKGLAGSNLSSPAKLLSDDLSTRFYWILKYYWTSAGRLLPGKSETIDKLMKVVDVIKGKIVEQQAGAHLCAARVEDHSIASIAVLLDVAPQDYVGLEADLLLSIAIMAFSPKEEHRGILLSHLDETPKYKYIHVNWSD